MADEFAMQLSINIPSGEQFEKGDMVNIRGNNPGEFQQNLLAFNEHMATEVARVAQEVKAQYLVVRELGGTVQSVDRSQTPQDAAGAPNSAPPQGYATQPPAGPQNGSQPAWDGPPQDQGYAQAPPQQQYQQPPQQQAPPANDGVPTQPPPHVGAAPQCSHGEKRFLAKPYKNGKPGYWMAWACPAQRGDNTQHDLEFIRNS